MTSEQHAGGLIVGTLAIINLIKDNLSDRYHSGFPILKELIQNADDGEAESIRFLWHPGMAGAAHALLQGPAIVVINNGAFKSDDAIAIRNFGVSHRVAESNKVGKFGLGIKSVFHLCEAFFFCASEYSDGPAGARSPLKLVNPWSGFEHPTIGSHFTAWDTVEQSDLAIIEDTLQRVLTPRWFVLWLPLRRKAHLPSNSRLCISPECYGDVENEPPGFLKDPQLPARLSQLLPLLRSVQSIGCWTTTNGDPRAVIEIDLQPDSQRPLYTNLEPGAKREFSGKIAVDSFESSQLQHYAGVELHSNSAELQALTKSDFWPRQSVLTAKIDEPPERPDKNIPHGAVIIQGSSDDSSLVESKACFLPLDTAHSDYRSSFVLTVHGYSFVDAGRQAIFSVPIVDATNSDSLEQLKSTWNRQLEQLVSLPQLLPALDLCIKGAGWPRAAEICLTVLVEKSKVFQLNRATICAEYEWLYCFSETGYEWRLVERGTPALWFPRVEDSKEEAIRGALPALGPLGRRHNIVRDDHPRLCLSVSYEWPIDALETLFDIRWSAMYDSYFWEVASELFLRIRLNQGHESRSRLVLRLCKEFLSRLSFDELGALSQSLLKFLLLLPGWWRMPIPTKEHSGWRHLVSELNRLPVEMAFVPDDLLTKELPCEARLDDLGLLELAQFLCQRHSELTHEAQCDFVVLLLERYQGRLGEAPSQLGALEFIPAFNCQARKNQGFSYSALAVARNEKRLCRGGRAQRTDRQLEDQLAKALRDIEILSLQPAVADVLFEKGTVKACTAELVLETLHSRPALADFSARLNLVKLCWENLSQKKLQDREILSLRYLLHGQPTEETPEVLWVGQSDSIWAELLRLILEARGESWRFLRSECQQLLGFASLKLRSPSAEEFSREASRCLADLAGLPVGWLNEQDIVSIYTSPSISNDVLKALPIHCDFNQKLIALSQPTYLAIDGGYALPTDLLSSGRVVKTHPEAAVTRRLRELCIPLDVHGALHLLLETPGVAESHPELIMNAVAEACAQKQDPRWIETQRRVAKAAWLPLRTGRFVAPSKLLTFPDFDEDFESLAQRAPKEITTLGCLAEKVRRDKAVASLIEHFLDREFPTKQLESLFLAHSEWSLGIKVPGGSEVERRLHKTLWDVPADLVPPWPIIAKLLSSTLPSLKDVASRLLGSLTQRVSSDRLVSLLKCLEGNHKRAEGSSRASTQEAVILVYNLYLAEYIKSVSDFDFLAERALFPSAAGTWQKASELVSAEHVKGIDKKQRLHSKTFKEVEKYTYPTRPKQGPSAASSSPGRPPNTDGDLIAYFREWRAAGVPEQAIGLFLLVFTDYDNRSNRIVRAACDLLGTADSAQLRQQFQMRPRLRNNKDYMFAPSLLQEKQIPAHSILGLPILASLEPDSGHSPLTTLVVGELGLDYRSNHYITLPVALRKIDIRGRSAPQLTMLLWKTFAQILQAFFWEKDYEAELSPAWETLSKTLQLDVRIAARLLQDHAVLILQQLPLKSLSRESELGSLLRQDNALRRRVAQEEELRTTARDDRHRSEAEQKKAQIHGELGKLIADDPETHKIMLEAVREKIARYFQYSQASIPFELWQNADDAVEELNEIRGALSQDHRRFVVYTGSGELGFVHWGRAINRYRFEGKDLSDRGYDHDLVKMLTLHASDKASYDGELTVTGKFGLGFKSVFLASSKVSVVSELLTCEVRGGMYPVRLSAAEFDRIRGVIGSSDSSGTGIWLYCSVQQNHEAWLQGILERFRSAAPLLVAFARQLREIQFRPDQVKFCWEGRALAGLPNIELAEARLGQCRQLLRLTTSAGTLVLGLRDGLPVDLDGHLPKLWITAPLQEEVRVGYALNGPFLPDIGRAQLARDNDENRRLMSDLAGSLATLLGQLHDCLASQEGRTWLGLRASVDSFWQGLWEVLTRATGSDEGSPVHKLFSEFESALWSKLLRERPLVPVKDPQLGLVRGSACEWFTEGVADLFELFCAAGPYLRLAKIEPARVVSKSVHTCLQQFGLAGHLRSLTLESLLEYGLGPGREATAEWVSHLPNLGQSLRSSTAGADVRGWLPPNIDFRLLSRLQTTDGRTKDFRSNRSLIEPGSSPGAKCLTEFVDQSLVLADIYPTEAVQQIRQWWPDAFPSLDIGRIEKFAMAAGTSTARRAVANYVLLPVGAELAIRLLSESGPGWLESELRKIPPQDLEPSQQAQRARLLQSLAGQHQTSKKAFRAGPARVDAPSLLRKILKWWLGVRKERLATYDKSLYPEGRLPKFGPLLTGEDRKHWTVLFTLGALQSMGRQNQAQHAGFLRLCRDRRWLDKLSSPDLRPEEFTGILDSYLESQCGENGIYYHWMRYLPTLYQISRFLDVYSQAFIDGGKAEWPRKFNPMYILEPKRSPVHQGNSISAPALTKALGLGACFVFRELVRSGSVAHERLHPYCYVPSSRLMTIMARLDLDRFGDWKGEDRMSLSADAHQFVVDEVGLEGAVQGDFDLCLIHAAEEAEFKKHLGFEDPEHSDEDEL